MTLITFQPAPRNSRLELLDDLAVAAHRTVEALQVAVDDEDQVVERLARRHADRTHRFGLVHFAVAAKAPDLAALGLRQAPVLQILHEARLVDRHQRSEAHRYRRKLPELRHQPRMRIGGDALAVDLLAKVVHLLVGEAAEHVSTCIHAGRRMALHEHQVAAMLGGRCMPEVVVPDVIERRRGSEAGDMAADVGVLVGAHDHRHRVPPHIRADALLDRLIARNADLLVDRNRIDIGGIGRKRHVGARPARLVDHLLDQEMRAIRTLVLDHAVDRVQPFAGFLRVEIGFDVHAALLRQCSSCRALRISIVCVAVRRRIAATRDLAPLGARPRIPHRGNHFQIYHRPEQGRYVGIRKVLLSVASACTGTSCGASGT